MAVYQEFLLAYKILKNRISRINFRKLKNTRNLNLAKFSCATVCEMLSVAQQLIHDLEKRPAKDVYCSYICSYVRMFVSHSLHAMRGAYVSSMHCEESDSVVYGCVWCSYN